MSTPYIGEIRMFAGNFAPAGWMFCHGQVLAIIEYTTVFDLIGTTYGGDGQSTFALPDMRGRVPVHAGPASSGTTYTLAEQGGVEQVTVTAAQLPQHSHGLAVSSTVAGSRSAVGGVPAALPSDVAYAAATPTEAMGSTSDAGGSQPHTNLQPYLGINYIIALFGVFPSPS